MCDIMKVRILFYGLLPLLFLLAACVGPLFHTQAATPVSTPVTVTPLSSGSTEKLDPYSQTSLWNGETARDLFKDLRAYRVGDLVTVNIVETSKASKKADTKTSRKSSIDAGISNLLGFETKMGDRFNFPAAFSNENMFKASMKNDFDGSGETSRDESMTASITARVIETLPNGNLFIKGTREVRVNNENQVITLSGLIRPVDISPDNTVLSSYVADAQIVYTGNGPVSDKQRAGWLMRFVDYVWPF